jgi:hypothetical protein
MFKGHHLVMARIMDGDKATIYNDAFNAAQCTQREGYDDSDDG